MALNNDRPKQRDDGKPEGPPPLDYGHGFGKLGLVPPPWTHPKVRGNLSTGPGDCGTTLRDGIARADGKGLLYGLEPLMAAHNINVYLCGTPLPPPKSPTQFGTFR